MLLRDLNSKYVLAVRANKSVVRRENILELTATKVMSDLIAMRKK